MRAQQPPPEFRSNKEFQIEKNAKNKAYAFIIACGLLDMFIAFCRRYGDIEDWHAAAVEMLGAEVNKKPRQNENS